MRAYPAALIPDPDGGFTVTFRDVPEAITEGILGSKRYYAPRTRAPIGARQYIAAGQLLSVSTKIEPGEELVPLSALGMAKAGLYDSMREQGVGRAELACRLRWHLSQVAGVLDLRHASRMEQVEAALAALGLRLIVDVARSA